MIQAKNLSMYYGSVAALQNVNFEVKQGEIIGLLGPNGAGKSTTLKIITTYTYPTEGNVTIDKFVAIGYEYETVREALQIAYDEIKQKRGGNANEKNF